MLVLVLAWALAATVLWVLVMFGVVGVWVIEFGVVVDVVGKVVCVGVGGLLVLSLLFDVVVWCFCDVVGVVVVFMLWLALWLLRCASCD